MANFTTFLTTFGGQTDKGIQRKRIVEVLTIQEGSTSF